MEFIKDRKSAVIGMIMTALLWSLGGLLIKMVTGHPLAISSARLVLPPCSCGPMLVLRQSNLIRHLF